MQAYFSTSRDALLASLVDSIRACGNRDVLVMSSPTKLHLRHHPLGMTASEECESTHLKLFRQQPEGIGFNEIVQRFNANIAYSGLLHSTTQEGVFSENKDKLIRDALTAIVLSRTGESNNQIITYPDNHIDHAFLSKFNPSPNLSQVALRKKREEFISAVEGQFLAVRRLVASKMGFQAFTQINGIRDNLGKAVMHALAMNDESLTYSVIETLNTLMIPFHESPNLKQEQMNKEAIMASERFLALLVDTFAVHALCATGALVVSALLDFFTYGICHPYSETTNPIYFDTLLSLVSRRGRALFKLFEHTSLTIVKGAGFLMKSMIDEADEDQAILLKELSLCEGSFLLHLYQSLFVKTKDPRNLATRQLSRILLNLWSFNNPVAMNLLERVFPRGLLCCLNSSDEVKEKSIDYFDTRNNYKLAEDHWNDIQRKKNEPLYRLEKNVTRIINHWQMNISNRYSQAYNKISQKKVAQQIKFSKYLPSVMPTKQVNIISQGHKNLLDEKPITLRKCRTQLGRIQRIYLMQQQKIQEEDTAGFEEINNDNENDVQSTLTNTSKDEDGEKRSLKDFKIMSNPLERNIGPIDNLKLLQPLMSYKIIHKTELNWKLFFHSFAQDHSRPDLVWNVRTREELRLALEKEMSEFRRERDFFQHSQTAEKDYASIIRNGGIVDSDKQDPSKPKSTTAREAMSTLSTKVDHLIKQSGLVSWNYLEFSLNYLSLASEPKVGDYFLRVLLEEDRKNSDGKESKNLGLSRIHDPVQFFNELFRRFLQYAAIGPAINIQHGINLKDGLNFSKDNNRLSRLEARQRHRLTMRCMCLHAMAIVYGRCHREIGSVNDIQLIVNLLDRTNSSAERDCFLLLLDKLTLNKCNADMFVEADGIRVLVDLACLAHLHTNLAPTAMQRQTASMSIKADECDNEEKSPASTQKEWYYCLAPSQANEKPETVGPISFNELKKLFEDGKLSPSTKVYAQGLDSDPRCRLDGMFYDSDSEETVNYTSNTRIDHASSWVSANKIIQLRWTIDSLILDKKKPKAINEQEKEESTIESKYDKGALLNLSAVSVKCVEILRRIVNSSSSRDITGGIVRPLPKPRKIISGPSVLPHIVQLLASFNPDIFDKTAILIRDVVDQNPILPRLYQTGIFFFILMYTGSNVLPIAKFLKDVHLSQAYKQDDTFGTDLSCTSILGNILPNAMVSYLENHSAEKFSEIFLGDFDTPEAIWNFEMRRFMIEKLACHLSDFTPRLKSNIRSIYSFIPIPVIKYEQLENELFCHNYYLRHLCNTQRFPSWPIREPICLLRDILVTWREENNKKPSNMSIDSALGELGFPPKKVITGNDEQEIRRAYYKLSMKYHPDKNPQGKDKFNAINKAYQIICNRSKLSTGPNRRHIQLIIKTQSIIYNRYRDLLSNMKYAGYPMLIKTIEMETKDEQLFARRNDSDDVVLLAEACELAYETVATSALNAEEMRRENGIGVFQNAFTRCAEQLSDTSSKPEDLCVRVCSNICSFMYVAVYFNDCREKICSIPLILKTIIRLLYYENLISMSIKATICVATFSFDYWLAHSAYLNGGIYLLLNNVLQYDFTLEESGIDHDETTNAQALKNRLALLSLYAISCILQHSSMDASNSAVALFSSLTSQNGKRERSGTVPEFFEEPEDDYPSSGQALCNLLTPYITRKLSDIQRYHLSTGFELKSMPDGSDNVPQSPFPPETFPKDTPRGQALRELAKMLTVNSINPYFIWDNRSRSELTNFLDHQIKRIVREGYCDLNAANEFKHTTIAEELIIGEIFISIYNKQPDFPLDNPKSFTIDLLHFIDTETTQSFMSKTSLTPNDEMVLKKKTDNLLKALEALKNVIRTYPGVEIQCIGRFKRLLSLLDLTDFPKIQLKTIEVIDAASVNQECLMDLAASGQLFSAIILFHSLPTSHLSLIELFSRLIVLTDLLKQFILSGGLIFLLHCLLHSPSNEVREEIVVLLAKSMANKQVGGRITALLCQYMPRIFVDSTKENASAFLHLFDGSHRNPELIWNKDCRDLLADELTRQVNDFASRIKDNSLVRWSISDNFRVSYKYPMLKYLEEDSIFKPKNNNSNSREAEQAYHEQLEEARVCSDEGPISVAGVYLYLYIMNPGWSLRQPEVFLDGVFLKYTECINKLPESIVELRLMTKCMQALINSMEGLLDSAARKGYVHNICELLSTIQEPTSAKSILVVFNIFTKNSFCVAEMTSKNTIGRLIEANKKCVSQELGLVGETFYNLFRSSNSDSLIAQALEHDLIGYVMNLIEEGLPPTIRNPGQVRALLIMALKEMIKSPIYGQRVSSRLEEFPTWNDYRDQDHALFLDNASSNPLRLTQGPTGGSLHSGYLTDGTNRGIQSRLPPPPPPM